MPAPKCLIIDPMHPSLFAMLQEIGWEYDYKPEIAREAVKTSHIGYQGIIVRSKTSIDRELLGSSPTVKFIGRAGAGLDNLDLPYLSEKKIAVIHASEGNRDAVGEHAMGLLLALVRNIVKADQEVKKMVWAREANRGGEIMGKTVGIIGYGNTGRAFARRLSGFGCNVLAYDRYKRNFSDEFCKEADMEAIFSQSEILSLHIPLTDETRMLVDLNYFKRFKKPIILINTARGEIVSLTAVDKALIEGYLRGAALDVLENEKLDTLTPSQIESFNSLRERSNVIFTPHIAGWTFESHVKINVALVQKISALQLA
ncbi:MAG TPA: NAD(P)-dependent oxidoreductase [Chryseolinea sp.]|jgi:D-3-phosphoglycerate dehydrogenase|nr:NAD(P)-dependent oxidoreductase [Chryseolinea sp.]